MRSQPRRGMTMVASRFNGWNNETVEDKRAFRYATRTAYCRVPKGTLAAHRHLPAIEMAGYHCLMPTASTAAPFGRICKSDRNEYKDLQSDSTHILSHYKC